MHDARVPVVPPGCCCRVNIGQTSFLLLFAFDCRIKGVCRPRFLLMITLCSRTRAGPKAKYLTEKLLYWKLLYFLCSTLNNFISVQHRPVVCSGTAHWEEEHAVKGFISCIWCECEIKWSWYLTTFKCVAFRHFKGNFLHLKMHPEWAKTSPANFSGVVHCCCSPERIFYPFPLEESLNKLATAFILLPSIHGSWRQRSCLWSIIYYFN